MGHQPTIFYVLENETLGTWWVGKMTSTLDGCGMPPYRSITQDELNEKLSEKYHYPNAYLTLVTLNKRWTACYGVERWLSKLEYKINKEPEKYEELRELLMAGWNNDGTETSTLKVFHVLEHNQPVDEIFKKLIKSRGSLKRCLNNTKFETRKERYQRQKANPDFMKRISREKVLMDMKKKQKLPKPEILTKHEIKDEEIKEVMEPQGIIYKISSPSGKVYVGQTVQSFEDRIKGHKKKSTKCTLLKRAIDKYGEQMRYEILEQVPQSQLDDREIFWIKKLNSLAPSGYNCSTGGNNKKVLTQVLKDNIRKGLYTRKIERDGYMGYVRKEGNYFKPVVRPNGKQIYLSNGGFDTREEAIEVLKEYTKDPDNFTKVDGTNWVAERPRGCVYKRHNKWISVCNHKYIGSFNSEKEARDSITIFLDKREILQSG
jgi:hypothetical protein